jgi:hypothetical protein
MSEDENPIEPSEESLREIPEQDFSGAIRPNRYANLRGAFQHAVFVDREMWEHFGSAERILETLRLLVDIAKKRTAGSQPVQCRTCALGRRRFRYDQQRPGCRSGERCRRRPPRSQAQEGRHVCR